MRILRREDPGARAPPLAAGRYLENAATCAVLSLAAAYRDIYRHIGAGKITGLSIAGAYARAAQGRSIKHWALGEMSITDRPCLPSATFRLRH